MTDRETLETMFTRAGIAFQATPSRLVLEVPLGRDKGKVEGYGGFATHFHWNEDGSLAKVAIWE